MISYLDKDYLRCLSVLRGQVTPPAPMRDLAAWISQRFGVAEPVDIQFDPVTPAEKWRIHPRLQVIFFRAVDADRFRDSFGRRHLDPAGREILDQLAALLAQLPASKRWLHRWNDRKLPTAAELASAFVVFGNFERPARWEINDRISEQTIAAIERNLVGLGIWKVRPLCEHVVFFFHTVDQVRASVRDGVQDKCRQAWLDASRPFDEFGILADSQVKVQFDSREVFERDYGGSWFAYTR